MKQTKGMKLKSVIFIFFSLVFILGQAATIKKLKGTRALISIDGTSLKEGDQYFGLDMAGKKRSLLKISKIKGDQATADVIKGKPEVGQTLSLASAASSAPVGRAKSISKASPGNSPYSHMGVLGSYMMDKMAVKFSVSGTDYTTNMAGTGLGVLGFYDYDVSHKFQLRGMGGLEQFQVSESCAVLGACNANITYLSGYGIAKYNFIKGPTSFWGGGGLGFLYAISKSSTVLDSSLITTNYVMTASFGAEFDMGQGAYFPVGIDYSIFPASPTVTASFIALRLGWGWR